jgi:hypothetical protein
VEVAHLLARPSNVFDQNQLWVNYTKLEQTLPKRCCPMAIHYLISSLMFKDSWSQFIINVAAKIVSLKTV